MASTKLETLEGPGIHLDAMKDLVNFRVYMQEETGKPTSFYIYQGEYMSPSKREPKNHTPIAEGDA